MEVRGKQMANNKQPTRLKVWRPQSRIAAYIKGNVKLEDIVSREKITKPENRHNRRAFLPLVNDDVVTTETGNNVNATFRSRTKTESSLSSISRYPSSTKTSLSLNRAQRLMADDLTRTIIEKNEYITTLHEQLDALRNCARVENIVVDEPLECVLDKMLECLLEILINLKNLDEHDERMIRFVTAIENEREKVLSSVTALRKSNSHKEEQLRQMSSEQTTLTEQLQSLRQQLGRLQAINSEQRKAYESVESDASNGRVTTEKLYARLRDYEDRYLKAVGEISTLSAISEDIRSHIEAEKKAFDELSQRSKNDIESRMKKIEELKEACKNFKEEKNATEERLKQLQQNYKMEIGTNTLKDEITRLENDVREQTDRKAALQDENRKLEEQLNEMKQVKNTISSEVKRLQEEKEALENTLTDWKNTEHGILSEINDKFNMATLASQETRWHELKQYFYKTALRAGLVQDDDRR